MGNENPKDDDTTRTATAAERRLRGDNLKGPEQKSAADHTQYEERRNPDTEVRLDGQADTLYADGLDTEDDAEDPPAGTRGSSFGIKP